jgi:hypothetical protein
MTERIPITEGRLILRDKASEAEIQDAICGYLRTQRIPHSITNAERSYNNRGQWVRRIEPGWPDVTGCALGGLMLAIEVKRVKGKLLASQAEMLHKLYQAGALVVIARSVDDVIEALASRRIRQKDVEEICIALRQARKPKPRRVKKVKREWV